MRDMSSVMNLSMFLGLPCGLVSLGVAVAISADKETAASNVYFLIVY